ncbi:MAG TPA: cation:dicarboxylase symporter family transporter, partial [Peptostreptococcaceae bacterium]|nr:cation:dicarboxylase symporter family transporter [Peptostreptococcaceae bacterium]
MKSFLKNYKSSLILLISIVIGGIIGVVMGPKATVLQPLGDLFLNLLFTILVPLVFFSVTSAIANMSGMKRFGKIMGNVVIVFSATALIASIVALLGVLIANPTKGLDPAIFNELMAQATENADAEKVGIFTQLVNTVTVNDFVNLFSRSNMLQLIIFSVLFGTATAMAGEKAK